MNSTSTKKLSKTTYCVLLLTIILGLQLNTFSQNVTVSGAVSGNGSFPTLEAAFTSLNGNAQSGANINVSILANTTETNTAFLNGGSWASLVISPSGGAARTVGGNLNKELVNLYGADNVMINGLNSGGNSLTFSNSNTGITAATLMFMVDATSNTITNCSMLGSSTGTVSGTVIFSITAAVGNSSNTISFCNIGPAGSALPLNGVYAIGNSGTNNAGNKITNCNIYDFFGAGAPSTGIKLSTFSTGWNINANRFYQTVPRTFTSTTVNNIQSCIQILAGTTHSVTNNIIGYSSSSSTGVYSLTATNAANSTSFRGIELSVNSANVTLVQGNTITAIYVKGYSNYGSGSYDGLINGIMFDSGLLNINANVIGGASGVDLINGVYTVIASRVQGITGSYAGGLATISNNTIGGLTAANPTLTTGSYAVGINLAGAGYTITNNVVGNTTPHNMRSGTPSVTNDQAGSAFGIYLSVSGSTTTYIRGNTVQNITCYNQGTGECKGIGTDGVIGPSMSYSVSANYVNNISSVGVSGNTYNDQRYASGICMQAGSFVSIRNNTVTGVSCTGTCSVGHYVTGISLSNVGTGTISGNYVSNITNSQISGSTSFPAAAVGIQFSGNTSVTRVSNNFVSLGVGNTDNTMFIGLHSHAISYYSSGYHEVVFNTVNIEGTVTGSGFACSMGFARGLLGAATSTHTTHLKNNLIINTRSGAFGNHYAVSNDFGGSASATGWLAANVNKNVLNANSVTVGYWNANQSFTNWKAASGGDANSYSAIPVTFVNAATGDLHINMGTNATLLESNGIAVTGTTVDIDAQSRPGPAGSVNGGGTAPDIGADEFDGVYMDLVPPTVTFAPLSSICSSSDRTINATVTDNVGVPVTGTLVPRIYFKKNSGAYVSSSGSLAAGTTSNGTWNFTISVSALGGVSDGDIISYFVIVQDKTNPPNVVSYPSGVSAVSVNTVTTPPAITTQTIQVKLPPTVSANSGSICSSQTFVIVPSGASSYVITGNNFSVSPATNTSYSLTGTGTNGCASSNTAVVNLTVSTSPTVSVSNYSICVGNSVVIVPGGAANYIITGNTFTVSPTVNTSYSITGTSTAGCASTNTVVSSVVVNTVPIVSINPSSYTMCSGSVVALAPTGASSYTINGNLFIVSPAASTSYTVGGISAAGCVSSNTLLVNVSVIPSPTITVNSGSICSGNTFAIVPTGASVYSITGNNFTVSPAVSTSYTINGTGANGCVSQSMAVSSITVKTTPTVSVNSGSICTGNSFVITPSGASSYTVTGNNFTVSPNVTTSYSVTGTSTAGCVSASPAVSNLSVIITPTVSVSGGSICSGQSFTMQPAGASGYIITGNTLIVSPLTTTSYSITGINLGCFSPSPAVITVTVSPSPVISVNSGSICSGNSFTISPLGNAATYTISGGSAVVSPAATTSYSVTGSSTEGCLSNQVISMVTVYSMPNITASASNSFMCEGETTTITATGADSYNWSNGATFGTIIVNPTISVTYTVTGINTSGCSSTKVVGVLVSPCTGLSQVDVNSLQLEVYPNPNNGEFVIELAKESEITITNVIGQVISKLHLFAGNNQIQLKAPAGVYFVWLSGNKGAVKMIRE